MILHSLLQLLDLGLLLLLKCTHPFDEFSLLLALLSVNLCTLLRELLEVEKVLDSKLLGFQQLANRGVWVLSQLIVKVRVGQLVQVVVDRVQIPLYKDKLCIGTLRTERISKRCKKRSSTSLSSKRNSKELITPQTLTKVILRELRGLMSRGLGPHISREGISREGVHYRI